MRSSSHSQRNGLNSQPVIGFPPFIVDFIINFCAELAQTSGIEITLEAGRKGGKEGDEEREKQSDIASI